MKLSNAIKTLERAGFVVTHDAPRESMMNPGTINPPSFYWGQRPGAEHLIEILRNGCNSDSVATIRVRRVTDRDDLQSDYFAGSFVPTLKRAIQWAT